MRDSGAARRILNFYGPTETCINAAGFDLAHPYRGGSVPIGRPLPGYRLYVLSDDLQPEPVGVAGELSIGGAGVARCYHQRPGPTADAFIPDPYMPGGARMYRTGDRARWRADGNLEFIGRRDHQLKLHGFRIEPGEIESTLLEDPTVSQAIVVPWTGTSATTQLAAFVVCSGGAVSTNALRTRLESKLPPYMVPSVFIALDELPLTRHAKVDRRRLSEMAAQHAIASGSPGQTRAEEMSPTEQRIAAIWEEVLGVVPVGPDDNFFHLGGHSLTAMRVIARMRERLQTELPLRDLFAEPTVRGLSRRLHARFQATI